MPPRPPTTPLVEIQKSSSDTHDLAVAAKVQADATKIIAENAQRSFNLNRPFVVVQNIPITVSASGRLGFGVVMINASSAPADNVVADCIAFLNGKPIPGMTETRIPSKPTTVGGYQNITLCIANIAKEVFDQIKAGTFQIFVRATYRGPAGRYRYCTKQQWENQDNRFADLGECDATKPFPQ